MTRIYLSPPDVRGDERDAVLRSIDSNWIAPVGPDLDAFEREVQAATGVSTSVGVTSGTAALHLALAALGVSTGDDVLVATFTFAAPVNAVVYVGARPVLVDVDAETWTLSPELVEEELRIRAQNGTLPRAAIPVDLYGQCADYGQLMAIFDEYGIPVVEDAAEALGASAFGRLAGSFGKCAAMSFNGNKIITTSSGGMFLSDDAAMSDRVRHLANQAREPVSHYEHLEVGYNYRLSNLLAAFGRSQLATLQDRIERRREINLRYRSAFEHVAGIEFMPIAPYGEPNFWLTCVLLDPEVTGTNPERVRLELENHEIESRRLWKPMHLQPAFVGAPSRINGVSGACFDRGLCLPSGSGMSDHELDSVIECLTRYPLGVSMLSRTGKEPLAIVGAGGFGREALMVARAAGRFEFIGFLDDGEPDLEVITRLGVRLLGTTEFYLPEETRIAIGIGMDTAARQRIAETMTLRAVTTSTPIIHPGSWMGDDVVIGEGSVICFGVSVTTNVRIGRHTHLNPHSVIGHDCQIGDYVTICPGAVIGGNVRLGDGCVLGSAANVLPGVSIGAGAFIGAGAVVTRDIPAHAKAKGVPARVEPNP